MCKHIVVSVSKSGTDQQRIRIIRHSSLVPTIHDDLQKMKHLEKKMLFVTIDWRIFLTLCEVKYLLMSATLNSFNIQTKLLKNPNYVLMRKMPHCSFRLCLFVFSRHVIKTAFCPMKGFLIYKGSSWWKIDKSKILEGKVSVWKIAVFFILILPQ